jgi:hypothetical protein
VIRRRGGWCCAEGARLAMRAPPAAVVQGRVAIRSCDGMVDAGFLPRAGATYGSSEII